MDKKLIRHYYLLMGMTEGRLGLIFEQKGCKGKAIEHHEKFLDLWENADPGIPEVEDARKHLAEKANHSF